MLFKVLTLLELTLSDDIGGRLKALASTKLKVKTAKRQSSNRVRTAHTLRLLKALASTKLKVETANRQSSNHVRTAHTRLVGYTGYDLLKFFNKKSRAALISCVFSLRISLTSGVTFTFLSG